MKSSLRLGMLIVAAAGLVVGCDASGTPLGGTSSAPTVSVTPGAGGGGEQAGEPTGNPGSPSSPVATSAPTKAKPVSDIGSANACVDTNSVGVQRALASLGDGWRATRASTDTPGDCGQLLWVSAVGGNSAGSPVHVLFFHDGKYLGTATSEPYAFTRVVASTSTVTTVEYRWLAGNEPFAAPQGGPATMTYTWNGSRVVMGGTLPTEVTNPHR
ncbi:LppP/LprE family lipoprotein [Nocardia camponoti]|uniref:LppP/LprE family lipoprotein n=1 Tax=Nocardia camponoti TaxID=1616106 RepID=A0A917V5Y8_9NOCA|nr:LppP/LprE family lipoprotein [Nocardia camponoti]GGK44538.1 hypothetical protein GCM10011591_15170 [Nocardia camponoti]